MTAVSSCVTRDVIMMQSRLTGKEKEWEGGHEYLRILWVEVGSWCNPVKGL